VRQRLGGSPLPSFSECPVIAAARPWNGAKVGKCYNNVQEMVRRHGGGFCYGWALTDYGPHSLSGLAPPPLYRRWLNHVVWRDVAGALWEVSPNATITDLSETRFKSTEFVVDHEATFDVTSDEVWFTRHCCYVPLRPEAVTVVELLTKAQHATSDDRNRWLEQALDALKAVDFRPREWKVESIGERTGSIWLIVD
jgi:hypothetical protein